MSSISESIRACGLLAAILGGSILCGTADAQSRMPPCPESEEARWHNCQGAFAWSNGERYVGEFRDDKRSGQGAFTWANGEKYVGEFRDNKRNGRGIRYSADGSIVEQGLWKDGELLKDLDAKVPSPSAAPVATAPAPLSVSPATPTLTPSPKGVQQSDPAKECNKKAEVARAEHLKGINAFSSKAIANYDGSSQSCYALITIMPKGRLPITIIESLFDLDSNASLAKIENQDGASSIGVISDKKYKGPSTPTITEVRSYIDEKMAGQR